MTSLPIEIINLICEWAAVLEQEWVPFFCPKTHNLTYKVNRRCKKLIENGEKILHNNSVAYVIEGVVSINLLYLEDSYRTNYKGILFQYGKNEFKLYIEFDSEKEEFKKENYIYRTMINFEADYDGGNMNMRKHLYLYLNGTQYGLILDAYYEHNTCNLTILAETY
jgi:hypothetical protein